MRPHDGDWARREHEVWCGDCDDVELRDLFDGDCAQHEDADGGDMDDKDGDGGGEIVDAQLFELP